MKLGSIYMIQRPKNNPRNGDTLVSCVQKVEDTDFIKQGVGICLLGQDGILLVDYLESVATIMAEY
jgi:hypothetical protein